MHYIENIIDDLTVEDFESSDAKMIAELISPQFAAKLLSYVSGVQIYFTSINNEEKIVRKYFKKRLPELSSEPNLIKKLALETKMNEKRVRATLKRMANDGEAPKIYL